MHQPVAGYSHRARPPRADMPWVEVAASYFATEDGAAFTPIGQNDAISWVELDGLFRRRDVASVEAYLDRLAEHGVTCLRLMLEYAQHRHRYFERPIGHVPAAMVQLWDDLFALSEARGLRLLLTPLDTFWTWRHWRHHPYNRVNGGPLDTPARLLLCRETREAIKARLTFAVTRWGGSGALFAWDLWNEIHPAQAEDSADCFAEVIHDLSRHVRALEMRLYGRSHPQTVSLFGPELRWRAHMPLKEPIFRHPDLDFASIHIYEEGTIDQPRDTVAPALAMARIVEGSLAEISDGRPFFDSEHGPIHSFKDHHVTLPEAFDDEYFRHMQWAHLAAGGAGGGMRWPNRRPHTLTAGMRAAQRALAAFLPLIDWLRFARRTLAGTVEAGAANVAAIACGDAEQAVIYLIRRDTIGPDGRLRADAAPVAPQIALPGLRDGRYRVTAFDTSAGAVAGTLVADSRAGRLGFRAPAFARDLALAVRRAEM